MEVGASEWVLSQHGWRPMGRGSGNGDPQDSVRLSVPELLLEADGAGEQVGWEARGSGTEVWVFHLSVSPVLPGTGCVQRGL